MNDSNMIIARNVFTLLKKQNKKRIDFAEALQIDKQIANRMLSGACMINGIKLKQISDFLGVEMEELTKISEYVLEADVIHTFIEKVESEQAKNTLQIADKLSEMILFHSKVRENGAEI